MPGQESRIGWEFHDSSDRFIELIGVGVGEIRPPHRAHNNEISANEQLLSREVIHDVAGGMAGRVDDFDIERAEFQMLAVFDMLVRASRRNVEGREETTLRDLKLRLVETVDLHFRARKSRRDDGVIGEMIEVAVREPHADQIEILPLGLVKKRRDSVVRSVEEDGLLRRLIADQETVRRGNAAGIGEEDHVIIRFRCSRRACSPFLPRETAGEPAGYTSEV
jgi:hypothetical protein